MTRGHRRAAIAGFSGFPCLSLPAALRCHARPAQGRIARIAARAW